MIRIKIPSSAVRKPRITVPGHGRQKPHVDRKKRRAARACRTKVSGPRYTDNE